MDFFGNIPKFNGWPRSFFGNLKHYMGWLGAPGLPIPPYAVFSADGVTVLTNISGLTYEETMGPSQDSIAFSLLGKDLLPPTDDITVTLDADFSLYFEIYNPDTSSWVDTSFTIAYTLGIADVPGFMVRMKATLTENNYSGIITTQGPNTDPFVLTVVGQVTASPYNSVTTAWINKVDERGGSVTIDEKEFVNEYTDTISVNEADRLWLLGCQNKIAGKTSIVNPNSPMITEVNGPTFTPGEGFNGDGLTQYLDTNFNPSVDGVKYQLNDACLFIYSRTQHIGAVIDIGCSNGVDRFTHMTILTVDGRFYSYLNQDAAGLGYGIATSQGFRSTVRPNSNTLEKYVNVNSTPSDIQILNSFNLINENIFLLALNYGGVASFFSPRQLAVVGIGSSLLNAGLGSATQQLGINLGFDV